MSTERGIGPEVDWPEAANLINDCDYLFARDVREIEELTLVLELVEAKAQDEEPSKESNKELAQLAIGARPIREDVSCRKFKVTFDRADMISYTVTNESYGMYPKAPERFTGNLFREFYRSHLLDFIGLTTYASNEYPGPLRHFEIVCLNHVFDVVCTKPPSIDVGMWVKDYPIRPSSGARQ